MVATSRISPEAFRQLPESMQPTELIDGEIIVSPTPVTRHQRICGRTFVFLDGLVTANTISGEAMISPMDVWLGDHCLQPDVFWVSGPDSRCQLGEDGYWYGAPDLVVEVLSPSTAHRDRGVKFRLYEEHGAREYWLIDPDGHYIEIYALKDGKFDRLGAFGKGESFPSHVLAGVTVEADKLLVV
jgi:Uma2 family endonuclease